MNLLSNSCQQTGKKLPTKNEPRYRVSVTVMVSLGCFVSSNTFVTLSVAISWPSAKCSMAGRLVSP